MTINSPIATRHDYDGNGIATSFPYSVKIDDKTFINVIQTNSSGVENEFGDLVVDIDYTVNGVGNENGGSVTFPIGGSLYSTLATGEKLALIYDAPIEQTLDIPNKGRVFGSAVEKKLDYIVKLQNQTQEQHDRSLKVSENSTLKNLVIPIGANKLLKWNPTADNFVLVSISSGTNVDPIAVKGDIVQGDASGDSAKLSIGSEGSILHVVSGLLAYLSAGDTNAVLQIIAGQPAWVTNPTLLLPTIADLTNMQHDHADAASGGDALQIHTHKEASQGGVLLNLGTESTATGGTSIDFTGIPAGTKKIIIMPVKVSLSGTEEWLIQIGPVVTPETSGYSSSASDGTNAANSTAGYLLTAASSAGHILSGGIILTLENAATFTWTSCGKLGRSDSSGVFGSGGSKSLAAELGMVRVTQTGSDTIDLNGGINIQFE